MQVNMYFEIKIFSSLQHFIEEDEDEDGEEAEVEDDTDTNDDDDLDTDMIDDRDSPDEVSLYHSEVTF